MNELNELQNIWQSGKTEIKDISGQPVPGELLRKLKKLESLQDRVNKVKMIILVLILFQLSFTLYYYKITSAAAYAGIGLIFPGVALFMIYYIRNQFNIKKLDFTSNSIGFADNAIRMLEKQNAIFKAPFLIFCVLLTIGSNIMLEGMITSEENSILLHVWNTLLIAFGMFMGFKIRMWRIKKEVMPIIQELKELKDNLDSGNE